jgi:cell division protein FtsW
MKKFSRFALISSLDRWLLVGVLPILAMGLIMVASSSMVISDRQFNTPFHYLFRQSIYLSVSFILAVIVMLIPVQYWRKWSGYLLLLSLALLAVVLIPGIGHEVNGSSRWIGLGFIGFQVSELAKFCVIVYMASYLTRHNQEVRTRISGFVKPLILIGIVSVLLLLEPDFGATSVIFATSLGMLFLAGVQLWQFLVLFLLGGTLLGILAVSSPYRLERLTTFLNPWANPFDSGYQLTQSLIAFGRGGIFGVGLGNSIQKLFYLPEAHTDFLFAVLAEELGLIGECAVIAFFVVVIVRALFIGKEAYQQQRTFAAYLAYGLAIWLGIQTFISIGVNCGLLPTKGLTLPLMSYGGSSMLISSMIIALLLRIAYESKAGEVEIAPRREIRIAKPNTRKR